MGAPMMTVKKLAGGMGLGQFIASLSTTFFNEAL